MPPRRERALWEIIETFRKVNRNIDLFSAELKRSHNITGPQAGTLKIIAQHGPVTLTEVCQRVFRHITTIAGIVDRLERDGYIRKKPDTHDRRKVMLEATPKGKRLAATAPFLAPARAMNVMRALPMEEVLKIKESMYTLLRIVEGDTRDLAQSKHEDIKTPEEGRRIEIKR